MHVFIIYLCLVKLEIRLNSIRAIYSMNNNSKILEETFMNQLLFSEEIRKIRDFNCANSFS